ncbi:DNRLRE domain-containing protein [Pedobacter changchengzhani]|uniref:DNRLRE domain-containing protein n=1 Tax=Pedobacter changchengzhani TaxID=2529274 RepID=A0A4R5MJZ7_9SPHI|nr:discoidin domain-containing protein [Pedobacter changchengzhani]TDG36007.1 DNRLRE domain-containing protein [Pedobacter changchengzhani]
MKNIFLIALILCSNILFAQDKNLALGGNVTANSENPLFPAKNAVDGIINRNSKWMSADVKPPHILEISFPNYCNINEIIIYTGIPENEKLPAEMGKAAGFWSAKNFKIQYWDDANWTDIPNAEVHENRLNEVKFKFPSPLNTFRVRMVCDDGEPISIMEFMVMGTETKNVAPVLNTDLLAKKEIRTEDQQINVKVDSKVIGKTMKYVGYNQGYYMPGSNASGWIEYSGVNSLRIWTTLNTYVPVTAVEVDKTLNSVIEFDQRKNELRKSPEANKYLKWDALLPIYSQPEKNSTNPMVFNYALTELKRLKIDPVIQIGNIDFNDTWSNKWQQWQRFYALAYYAAKTGDVTMFAMQNEPNHRLSGMTLSQWISGMKIVSDAIHCAIADVNLKYNKNLKAEMVGPVTAGNNPEWWRAVMQAIKTDYHGKKVKDDLIEIFSTHSYNSPAGGYTNRVNDIRKIIEDSHPDHKALPIVFTELGRWMNSYLIDKEETMDSPSLFTEWAGIYTNNTLNQAYGMWAFKFSNTTSDAYSEGVKSGHHFTWQGKRVVEDGMVNLAANMPVTTFNGTNGKFITDGVKTDSAAWTSDGNEKEKWLEINLKQSKNIGSAIVYTGSDGGVYTAPDRIRNFKLQYDDNGTWVDIKGGTAKENKFAQLYMLFKSTVKTSKIRFITAEAGPIKVREIKLFDPKYNPDPKQKDFDISGIQRTGEVVRLFAKGFKNERPLFKTKSNVVDENFDSITSFDEQTGNYYMWLVQRGEYKDQLTIDLSALNIDVNTPISAETVSPTEYGSVTEMPTLDANGRLKITLGNQSVTLLTIPTKKLTKTTLSANADATVIADKFINKNYGTQKTLNVQLNAGSPEKNEVSYIQFIGKDFDHTKRAFLTVNGSVSILDRPFRIHVYAIPNTNWKENELTWLNAPLLDGKEALLKAVGTKAFVAGELAFTKTKENQTLDVTDILKKHVNTSVTFVLIRETRQMGDDEDKGRELSISSKEGQNPPKLEIWK